MNITQQTEYIELMKMLKVFHNKEPVIYTNTDARKFIYALVKKWLAEKNIEGYVRGTNIRITKGNPDTKWYGPPQDAITCSMIQIHNGKGAINNSRWINKVTVRLWWIYHELKVTLPRKGTIARTDAKYLEPTPTDFSDFIKELFNLLVYKE